MPSKLMRHVVLIACSFLPGCYVQAASFDCAKAVRAVDKKICASHDLSALDGQLGDAYEEAHNTAQDPKQLRDEQRAWLQKRDQCLIGVGSMQQCQQLYRARIAELQKRSLDRECKAADGPDLDRCAAREADAADKELADLIGTMRARLIHPDTELAAQKAWEEYRDEECESRAALNGTWGSMQTQQCRVDFDRARIKELKEFHFCDENGCPAKK